MPKSNRTPKFLSLQRRQLDTRLKSLPRVASPRGGWTRALRTALGMSAAQLGKKLGMTQQGVLDLERRETNGSITISKLSEAAAALNCELQVIFVPKQSLEETVRLQAEAKARDERNRIVHTMRLEAQHDGVDEALNDSSASDVWMTTRISRLWD